MGRLQKLHPSLGSSGQLHAKSMSMSPFVGGGWTPEFELFVILLISISARVAFWCSEAGTCIDILPNEHAEGWNNWSLAH